MKIADLYVRVSTDEQADKGYSQHSQEELLRRYCDLNGISVRHVIYEDHSAKTFNRPEWKKYLVDLRQSKAKTDHVLFLKIFLPKYKDEETQFIKGSHTPIISEALYYRVQDVLNGRKRPTYRPKIQTNEDLPLRGFLICPQCGKVLTGSSSKGRHEYYTYYHCTKGCTCRFKADYVNGEFLPDYYTVWARVSTKKKQDKTVRFLLCPVKSPWQDNSRTGLSLN